MKPLNIVLISQNCHPKLGPRPHRTTELAKELARRGHNVTVYALLGNYDYREYSKETGIKFKNLGKSKFGLQDNTEWNKNNLPLKIFRKLFRKTLEFPMIELMWMTERALKKESHVDYLITIAAPHPIHWGTANFVKKNPDKIKFWTADCGDPFMGKPYMKHPSYFEYFERRWNKYCDKITIPIEEAKRAYYKEYRHKIEVIPQGFDFSNFTPQPYTQNKVPTFAYSGILYKGLRDPSLFLDYISNLSEDYRFIVYTKSHLFFEPFKSKFKDRLEIRDYVPRTELLFELSQMDFLINFSNESGVQQPSKLIDYYQTGRPTLEISSSFSEMQRLSFNEFLNRNYTKQISVNNIEDYNIVNVADKFLRIRYEK